jgi:hypothetical protein
MEHGESSGAARRAEELLRLLAAASVAVRLYPPSSPMRAEAVERFVLASNDSSATYPVQVRVDRGKFWLGETSIGEGQSQIAALAESLHSLQVGQLIVAPGIRAAEAAAFLRILGSDAKAVRADGGMRAALLDAGVMNLAVVEVSLRASTEAGIFGLDLTAAPLKEIAPEVAATAETWLVTAAQGVGRDDMKAAVDRLESAARVLAARRAAEALLQLDEASRQRVLACALTPDQTGDRMDGMLGVVATMRPAALARLLRLVADRAALAADAFLGALDIPEEIAEELTAFLRPSAQSEQERGVPGEPDVPALAAEATTYDHGDQFRVEALMRSSTSADTAARALATTIRITRQHPDEDSARALAEATRSALRAGSFGGVAEGLELLNELHDDPALQAPVAELRASLAEELFDAYASAPAEERSRLARAASQMPEAVGSTAGRVLRAGESARATAAVRLIAGTRDARLLPLMNHALEHPDGVVRTAAVSALADAPSPGATALLERALTHKDAETRRAAAREIGRARITAAVPALVRLLERAPAFEHDLAVKTEAIDALGAIDPGAAAPVLRQLGNRRFALNSQARELRQRARRTSAHIDSAPSEHGEPRNE